MKIKILRFYSVAFTYNFSHFFRIPIKICLLKMCAILILKFILYILYWTHLFRTESGTHEDISPVKYSSHVKRRKNTQHSSFTYTPSQFPCIVLSIAVPFSVSREWNSVTKSFAGKFLLIQSFSYLLHFSPFPHFFFFSPRGFIQIMRYQNPHLHARAPLCMTKVRDFSYMRT